MLVPASVSLAEFEDWLVSSVLGAGGNEDDNDLVVVDELCGACACKARSGEQISKMACKPALRSTRMERLERIIAGLHSCIGARELTRTDIESLPGCESAV